MRFISFLGLVVVVAVVVVCCCCCCCCHMEPFKQFQCWSFRAFEEVIDFGLFLHLSLTYHRCVSWCPRFCVPKLRFKLLNTSDFPKYTPLVTFTRHIWVSNTLTLWFSFSDALDLRDATSWHEWSIKVRQVSNTTETQLKKVTDIREASCWSIWCTHGNDTTEHSVEERDRSVGRA